MKRYKLKKKYKISLLLILILLSIASTIAVSYSLWFVTKNQDDTNLVVSGCFDVIYNDLDDNDAATSINLANTYPISDELGMQLNPYKVTIKNNCSIAADYTIALSSTKNNTLGEEYIKVYYKDTKEENGPLFFNELNSYEFSNDVKTMIEEEKAIELENSYILASGILNPQDEETYELKMWVKKEATDEAQEKEFTSIVSFEAYATDSTN